MADEKRAQRTEARERRRSLTSQPFEELDEAAERESESTPLAGVKRAVGTAAAAALAGALAGAAKAYTDRRTRHQEQEDPSDEERNEEPDVEQQPRAEGTQSDERQHVTDEAEPQDDGEPQAEAEPEPAEDERHSTDERETDDASSGNGTRGASQGDAAQIVNDARAHLKELLGIEAESVSALQRSNGSWHITLEVVEVRRIPDSTDVLASYEVVLDDDGGVVSMERTRRYRRSHVEGG